MTLDYGQYEKPVTSLDLGSGPRPEGDRHRLGTDRRRSRTALLIAAPGLIRLQRAYSVRTACGQRAVGMRRPDSCIRINRCSTGKKAPWKAA